MPEECAIITNIPQGEIWRDCQRTRIRGRPKTARGVSKEGRYITNSCIGIGTYHINYLRTQKEGCGCVWNTWGIPHHRHGQGCHHGTTRNTGGTNGEYRTKHLSEFSYDWKRTDGAIYKFAEVNLRVTEECSIILWNAGVVPEVKRVHHQPIRSMYNQYDGKWKSDDHNMAHWWLRNISRWRRWSDKSNRLDEGNIRQSHKVILWEEERLHHNGPWLLSGWRVQSDNDGLPK